MNLCITDADTYACSSPHDVVKDFHDEAEEAAYPGMTQSRYRRRKKKRAYRDSLISRLGRKAARLAARGY